MSHIFSNNDKLYHFNPEIEIEDIFSKRSLELGKDELSIGLKEQVEIQDAFLTNYIEDYLQDPEFRYIGLTEETKINILDDSLDNFHLLVNFFFFPNQITGVAKYPLYLPLYSVIDMLIRNETNIVEKKGILNYNNTNIDFRMELLDSIYKNYKKNFPKILQKDIPTNIDYEEQMILYREKMFFYNYELYEKHVKETRMENIQKQNVNIDNFNNQNIMYDVAFDTDFHGGKKKRKSTRKSTRNRKTSKTTRKRKQKGKSKP
jgi:hypothetical protein